MEDPVRIAAGLPIGIEGGYFVSGGSNPPFDDKSIIDYNTPPEGQPGLWCQWVPNKDGEEPYTDAADNSEIGWNGVEKFYHYIEWLEYIIEHFLKPWGYVLNGEVEWAGESREDIGMIVVKNNVVTKLLGAIVYKIEEEWAAEAEMAAKKKANAEALKSAKINLEKAAKKPAKKAKKKPSVKKPAKAPKKYLDSRNIKKAAKKASKKR